MKLRHEFSADGTLWYENPFPRVSDQFTRVLFVVVLLSLLGPLSVALRFVASGSLDLSSLDLFFLVAPFVLAYEYWRRVRHRAAGLPDASTPRRIGFAASEFVWEGQGGAGSRFPWARIRAIGVAMRPGLSVTMFVRTDENDHSISNVNLDLLIKARWALRLFWRSSLDVARLADEWKFSYPRTVRPPDDAVEIASDPPLFLLPDRAILWKNDRGQEVSREEVDTLRLHLLGGERFVVTVRDHQAAVILHPEDADPLLEWLGNPPPLAGT